MNEVSLNAVFSTENTMKKVKIFFDRQAGNLEDIIIIF